MGRSNKVADAVSSYDVTAEQLSNLMDASSLELLADPFGGVHRIVEMLKSTEKDGIDTTQTELMEERKKVFGENKYPVPPPSNPIVMFFENLQDLILIILIVFAVISIGLGLGFPESKKERAYAWLEGFAILVAVFIVDIVTTVNDYSKERKFRSLSKESKKINVSVQRDGRKQEVLIDNIVVGDIVILKTGDQVPADGLFLSGFDLKTDESAVTGETHLIKKNKNAPFLKSGTVVAEGTGEMVIIAVGVNSMWGKALAMIAKGKSPDEDKEKKKEDEEEEPEELKRELTKEEKKRKEEAESDQTPLEMKLEHLATSIGKIGIAAGIITTAGLFIGWIIRKVMDVQRGEVEWEWHDLVQIVHFIIIGVTIVVVAVPEGLPLAVTISLAYSVREMLKDNNLVRVLAACETMGGATNICSDKTGTLTLNQMNVVQGFFGGKDYRDSIPLVVKTLNPETVQSLIEGIVVNSKCTVMENDKEAAKKKVNPVVEKMTIFAQRLGIVRRPKPVKSNPEDRWKVVGSKTEGALILMLIKHFNKTMEWPEMELKSYMSNHRIAMQYPFNPKIKRMSTIVRLDHFFDPDNPVEPDESIADVYSYRVYTKGASEIVLQLCTGYLNQNGTISLMDENKRKELNQTIENMANQGLRTLCLAYKDFKKKYPGKHDAHHRTVRTKSSAKVEPLSITDVSEDTVTTKDETDGFMQDSREIEYFEGENVQQSLECDLTVISIVGIKDPLREEVPDAVKACKKAGIIVRMITGDNILTAKHIARECGILTDEGIAIEGPDFRKLKDDEIKRILPRLQVMARSSPADKHKLVTRLRELGEVVAVTGDGTNDGPALKAADVGLSMGLSGTQVAKEASDIIILDDNFESIVQSVKWGRSVFENIRKFLQFQISVNVVALAVTCITAIATFIIGKKDPGSKIISYHAPLTAIQLLWVNLIMDTFAALALATEKPSPDLLFRKPYGRKEPLISFKMWIHIIVQSAYQLIVTLFLYYGGQPINLYWDMYRNQQPDVRAKNIDTLNRSLVFNTFVFCQIVNQLNARKINMELNIFQGLHKSWMFIGITFVEIALQVVFVSVQGPIEKFTQTKRLHWKEWLISIGFALLSLPIAIVTRLVYKLFEVIFKKNKEDEYVQQQEDEESEDKEQEIIPDEQSLELVKRDQSFRQQHIEVQEAVGPIMK